MPKCSMPPGARAGVADLHGVAQTGQMIGSGKPAGTSAHHQHALAAGRCGDRRNPALARREVAEEALHRMDADRGVQILSIATGFARVVTNPSVDRGERVVAHKRVPSLSVFSRLRLRSPHRCGVSAFGVKYKAVRGG